METKGESIPSFLFVKIATKEGKILSNSEVSSDGYYTSKVFDSNLIIPPVSMTTLLPNQEISGIVKINKLLGGLDIYVPNFKWNVKEKCLTFKFRVYLDENLTRFFETVSAPFCIKE